MLEHAPNSLGSLSCLTPSTWTLDVHCWILVIKYMHTNNTHTSTQTRTHTCARARIRAHTLTHMYMHTHTARTLTPTRCPQCAVSARPLWRAWGQGIPAPLSRSPSLCTRACHPTCCTRRASLSAPRQSKPSAGQSFSQAGTSSALPQQAAARRWALDCL